LKHTPALESSSTNFRLATILNNPIFKRGPRDRLLLDYDFFFSLCTTPVLSLIAKINFTDLFVGNRFKTIGQLELLFNSTLDNEFFHLFRNAFNYFKISHRKELSSTVAPIPMSHFCTIKKPGKQFRLLLETIKNEKKLENLQNVKTFRNLTGLTWPENFCFKVFLGGWSFNYLPCRFATFLFKFANNLLGINTRVSHFDNAVSRKCTICRVANVRDPEDESFSHVFFDCPVTKRWRNQFENKFLEGAPGDFRPLDKKLLWFTGSLINYVPYKLSLQLAILYFQFCIWECKLQKIAPSFTSIMNRYSPEVISITNSNKKLKLSFSNAPPHLRRIVFNHGD
jgi:hypothetical protein